MDPQCQALAWKWPHDGWPTRTPDGHHGCTFKEVSRCCCFLNLVTPSTGRSQLVRRLGTSAHISLPPEGTAVIGGLFYATHRGSCCTATSLSPVTPRRVYQAKS